LWQVAARVGYDSDASFDRAFKRATRTSPAAYRRNACRLTRLPRRVLNRQVGRVAALGPGDSNADLADAAVTVFRPPGRARRRPLRSRLRRRVPDRFEMAHRKMPSLYPLFAIDFQATLPAVVNVPACERTIRRSDIATQLRDHQGTTIPAIVRVDATHDIRHVVRRRST